MHEVNKVNLIKIRSDTTLSTVPCEVKVQGQIHTLRCLQFTILASAADKKDYRMSNIFVWCVFNLPKRGNVGQEHCP